MAEVSKVSSADSKALPEIKEARVQSHQAQVQKKIQKKLSEDLKQSLKVMNNIFKAQNIRLAFVRDRDVGITSVRVIDMKTGDVIKIMPPEQVIQTVKMIKNFIQTYLGLVLDEYV